jgi:hypothetical protein
VTLITARSTNYIAFTTHWRNDADVLPRPSAAELPISTFCHIDDVFNDAERLNLDAIPRRQRPSDADYCTFRYPAFIYLPEALPIDVLDRRQRSIVTAYHSSVP